MSLDQLGRQSDPLRHRNVRQPNRPRVWLVVEVDQLTEVGIHADQDPPRAARELEECPVSRIGSELPSLNNVVALLAEASWRVSGRRSGQRGISSLSHGDRRQAYPGR